MQYFFKKNFTKKQFKFMKILKLLILFTFYIYLVYLEPIYIYKLLS